MTQLDEAAPEPSTAEGMAPAQEGGAAPSLQERIEASGLGRWVISAFLAVTVVALLAWNLPLSELRRMTEPFSQPYVNATGLTQTWNLFAPDPLTRTRRLEARILYTDGSSATWQAPVGGAVFGQYRTYRWYAQMARLRYDASSPRWEPFANWVIRAHDHGGRMPAEIELVRHWRDVAPPGGGPGGLWQQETFYRRNLAPEAGR